MRGSAKSSSANDGLAMRFRLGFLVAAISLIASATGCDTLRATIDGGLDVSGNPRSVAAQADRPGDTNAETTSDVDPSSPEPSTPTVPFVGAPASFRGLVEAVRPGVVGIYTTQHVDSGYMYRGPYGLEPRVEERQGLGSGFIVDEAGFVLTNSHVISQADEILIRTSDDRSFPATVVGVDPLTDLALIKVPAFDGIAALPFGDSNSVAVGDWLVAVGNPYGLSFSVTAGILSGRGRRDVPLQGPIRYVDFLQTDVSINPGNSGGPLISMSGEVIGITTAVNRAAQGIGFAIPSNMARTIYLELKEQGQVQRSWIGVRISDVPDKLRPASLDGGAFVTHVARGGPADRAGLEPGDIIVRFGDHEIERSNDLPWLASTAGVGAEVSVDVFRDGGPTNLSVILGELPN